MEDINIIFGAPGCGKTTYLLDILEKELKQNEPNKIAFVSFTRKGTYEGRNRAIEKFGYDEKDFKYFRTLHSIAFREGGFSKYDVINKRDYKEFSRAMGMTFTGYYTEEFYHNDDRYLFQTILERNNNKQAEKFKYGLNIRKLNDVRNNYIRFKEFKKIVDFTDMIERFVETKKALPVDVAIIDEAQDLTSLQWEMCKVAFKDCKRVYIAGDDEQAIYEWSGADVEQFLNLTGKKVILHQSYRLQKDILKLAKQISKQIKNKVEKKFEPIGDAGKIYFHNYLQDISIDPNETWYFLCRNNWFLKQYSEQLNMHGLPYYYKDKFSVNKKDVAAINTFEKIRKTRQMSETEEMTIKRYVDEDKIDLKLPWFMNFEMENDLMMYYRDLIKNGHDINNKNLMINTIHGVKGGEADNVVIKLDFTKSVRENFENNPDSELRCLYVACTRAKKNLHIVFSNSKNGYDSYIHF